MSQAAQYLIIYGKTDQGQRFRPSDWAERLAGVLAQYRPIGAVYNPWAYSPYASPRRIDGLPCVVIDHRLRDLEPLAWKFACDFASSNNLLTADLPAPLELDQPSKAANE